MPRILADVNYLLMLMNLVLFLIQFKKLNKAFRIFTLYLLVISIIQLITSYYSRNGMNNLFLSHFYFFFQFLLLSFFYYTILTVPLQKKILLIGLVVCPVILGIQYYFDPSLFFGFNLFEIFITSFLIVIYAMFHFYNIMNESKEYYYLNTGIFIYIFGSTVLFLTGNILSTLDKSYGRNIWALNGMLYIIYQIYIFIEWKRLKNYV